MTSSRRIATSIALAIFSSTLGAIPSAFAVCGDHIVVPGPYGSTDRTIDTQDCNGLPYKTYTTKPPVGNAQVRVKATLFIQQSFTRSTQDAFKNDLAKLLGNTILGLGKSNTNIATTKTITPKEGTNSEVIAIPGNPIEITVNGFKRSGTKVEIKLEVSGVLGKNQVGFFDPNAEGQIVLPITTVKTGESATFTLIEWATNKSGVIDYSKGKVSQEVVSIRGTGVSTTKTNQLSTL